MSSSRLPKLEFPTTEFSEIENFAGTRSSCTGNNNPTSHTYHSDASNPSNVVIRDLLNYANCVLKYLHARTTNLKKSHILIYPYLERLVNNTSQIPALEAKISALEEKVKRIPEIEKKLDRILGDLDDIKNKPDPPPPEQFDDGGALDEPRGPVSSSGTPHQ